MSPCAFISGYGQQSGARFAEGMCLVMALELERRGQSFRLASDGIGKQQQTQSVHRHFAINDGQAQQENEKFYCGSLGGKRSHTEWIWV